MQKARKIYLIGFMGSGKSTTGKNLASFLNWSFIDLDDRIESIAGMRIPDIFAQKGETYFRQIESEALLSTASGSEIVVSTGGGTPCFGDNMNFMLENGLTIYLKMTLSDLEKRLMNSSYERPLLKDVAGRDLRKFISSKLAEREEWYSMATIVADGMNSDISDLYSLIKNRIIE